MKPTRLFLAARAGVVAFLLLAGLAGTAAAASLYVRAAGTDLKDKPSPAGARVVKLDIGQSCEVVAKEGNWTKVKVKTPDKKVHTGYVFAAKLSEDRPDKERFGGAAVAASASEGDTAMALRGLSATSEKYAERSEIKPEDVAAVKKMEQRKVSPEELARFLKEGKLGEYAP